MAIEGQFAVVSGGTDGMGAATALLLAENGANVLIIGRSQDKADAMVARAAAAPGTGTLRAIVSDFASMKNVVAAVEEVAALTPTIDLLVHAVGILISRTEHTDEGIEKDFAVSYLSRFVFLETASARGLLRPSTRLLNIAASAPKVPRYQQQDFSDLDVVTSRVGLKSHGQAQLANELLTAQAAERYGVTAIGYGPGSVNTSIRREVPGWIQAAMRPFFARGAREPGEVARELVELLLDPELEAGQSYFANKTGRFPAAAYIADPAHQADVLAASLALTDQALSGRTPGAR